VADGVRRRRVAAGSRTRGQRPATPTAGGAGRSELVPLLQRTQAESGYVPPEAVRRIARTLGISESEVYGVATFYAQFRFSPPGRHRLRVCLGTACHVKGGVQMMDTVQRRLGIGPGETTADREYDLERVACLGCCALAPVVTLDDTTYAQMSVLRLQEILDERSGDGEPA
jgi:NADH-quinone oxidoreductase subunit E